jgi:hypothetical protein
MEGTQPLKAKSQTPIITVEAKSQTPIITEEAKSQTPLKTVKGKRQTNVSFCLAETETWEKIKPSFYCV